MKKSIEIKKAINIWVAFYRFYSYNQNNILSNINNQNNDYRINSNKIFSEFDLNNSIIKNKKVSNRLNPYFKTSDDADINLLCVSSYNNNSNGKIIQNILELNSLLEVLLRNEFYERAKVVLNNIFQVIKSNEILILSFNKYLSVWGLKEFVSLNEFNDFLKKVVEKNNKLVFNHRTNSIILTKKHQKNDNYLMFLSQFDDESIKKILSNVDILGTDFLIEIFETKVIQEKHVPTEFNFLYIKSKEKIHQNLDEFKTKLKTKTKTIASMVYKNVELLKEVNSFGLKNIRDNLLGLKTNDNNHMFDKFLTNLNLTNYDYPLNSQLISDKNFFSFYKTLKTKEQKDLFNSSLNLFNESRQRKLESKGLDSAKDKWKYEYEKLKKRKGVNISSNLNLYLYDWHTKLVKYIEDESHECKKILKDDFDYKNLSSNEKKIYEKRKVYAPYFLLVSPNKLGVITILEILKLISKDGLLNGIKLTSALISIGKSIELEYRSQILIESEKFFFSKKLTSIQWKKILRNQNYFKNINDQYVFGWSNSVSVKFSSVLLSFLMHIAKVSVKDNDDKKKNNNNRLHNAFYHTYSYIKKRRVGVIKAHNVVIEQLNNSLTNSYVSPNYLPMLTPPLPWSSYMNGGYLFSRNLLIRTKDSPETLDLLISASKNNKINKVYSGLNVLGNTAWTVNKKVFKVIAYYWNKGESFLDIPPIKPTLKFPPSISKDSDPIKRFEYNKKVRNVINHISSVKSQRCDINYKLEIARAFLEEKFYFPHNIDFRGRAYPLSPNFNHLGNDLTRSLFLFWEGKELGETGLKWLKIHLANVYGNNKLSFNDRIKFVDNNLSNVFDSAKNPYALDSWWLKGDDPWQTLSVCFELYEAYQIEDPKTYVSHLPVHQDGTCNGLQHYAALGGDIEGAKQVNLIPDVKPNDVYNYVSELVKKVIKNDFENNNKFAKFFHNKINRKIVKQTVMTNVYGVTFIGATEQIKKQVENLFLNQDLDRSCEYVKYLTLIVFKSIKELFKNAHLIQDWLEESSNRISKSFSINNKNVIASLNKKPHYNTLVVWTTLLGFPCVQPYRKLKTQIVSTNLQDVTLFDPYTDTLVDFRKQKAAFPPNFVHSLDATHMLMTSEVCGKMGMSFASVHDSFWTHACDVDEINIETRKQFVKLHSQNLILTLKEEFEERYKDHLRFVFIPVNHEIADKIKSIRKCISKDLGRPLVYADEIILEKKRQELLHSSDPQKVIQGKETVTTISVLEGLDIENLIMKQRSPHSFQILSPLTFPSIPKKGELDIMKILESPYFFS